MKVYLAGPMTGIPEYNYPEFARVAAAIRARGWEVLSPHEEFGGDKTRTRAAYMREDIRMLLECEGVVLLSDWIDSPGARLEVANAQEFGLHFFDENLIPLLPLRVITKTENYDNGA